jgi:hypothetical protein
MKKINPYKILVYIDTDLSDLNIRITGKLFLNTRNIYLSASNQTMFNNISTYNPFLTGSLTQKNSYPSFQGIQVNEFTIFNDKKIEFVFPELPKTTGFVDVIIENEAGYGKLTTDTRLPFISSFNGAIDIQFPWSNGIQIVSVDENDEIIDGNGQLILKSRVL